MPGATSAILLAAAALTFGRFGDARELLRGANPWSAYEEKESELTVTHLLRTEGKPADARVRCDSAIAALRREQGAGEHESPLPRASLLSDAPGAWRVWEPWSDDEMGEIRDCDEAPCQIKIDVEEGRALGAASKDTRFRVWLSLIAKRAIAYGQRQEMRMYEFPGPKVDAWRIFEHDGFGGPAARPAMPELFARRLDLAPGKVKVMHQVLDQRFKEDADHLGATFWLRDVYTDHYFDSWGEWAHLRCDLASGGLYLMQELHVDMDMLKKHDLITVLGKGKLKAAFEEQGKQYLGRRAERVTKK